MKKQTSKNKTVISIPELAVQELDQVEQMNPEFSMQDLVDWVNQAVARFLPQANESGDKRVSNSFTVRTLRHYQTLECLDSPHKDGRRAIYSFRHYLQALLIRKLLYLGCSPDSIRETLKGKTNPQYKDMLFGDLNIIESSTPIAVLPGKVATPATPSSGAESWTRITLGPGAELHLQGHVGSLSPAKRRKLLAQIKKHLNG